MLGLGTDGIDLLTFFFTTFGWLTRTRSQDFVGDGGRRSDEGSGWVGAVGAERPCALADGESLTQSDAAKFRSISL